MLMWSVKFTSNGEQIEFAKVHSDSGMTVARLLLIMMMQLTLAAESC
jgi:hypothetical protein